MKQIDFKARHVFIILIPAIYFLTACSERFKPDSLSGTYTGNERIMIRFDKEGQYIYRDAYVMVSLVIDSTGNVIGMVGDAAFEGCSIKQNRGWIGRQLNIKTDYIISGMLKGNTFEKDTVVNKDISIPFNIENGELRGSLFLTANGQDFPMIKSLKLKIMKD